MSPDDRDKKNAYARSWYQANKERLALARKENPRPAKAEYRRRYYRENRVALLGKAAERRRAWPERAIWHNAKGSAKRNGLAFDLEISDIHIPDVCPLLGISLEWTGTIYGISSRLDNLPTIDRVDNAKGYVKGNVWIISWRANTIKRDASIDELERLSRALRARLSGG